MLRTAWLAVALTACAPRLQRTDHGWVRVFRDRAAARVSALAAVPDGVVAGVEFNDGVDLGAGRVDGLGWDAAAVARYDANGALRWAQVLDTAEGRETVNDVAITDSGDVLAVGVTNGPLDCGLGPMHPDGDFDVWLCAFDGSSGEPLWARLFGGAGADGGTRPSVAALPGGGVALATAFRGVAGFGGPQLTATATEDGLVAAYDDAGTLVWQDDFGGRNYNYGEGVVALADGVVVAGTFEGTANLGGHAVTAPDPFGGLIARLDSGGSLEWSLTPYATRFCGVDTDARGDVYLAAEFTGTASVPGLPPVVSAGGQDVWVLALDPDGTPLWLTSLGGAGDDSCFAFDVDGDRIALGGWFFTALTLPGGDTLDPPGGDGDGWYATLDPATGQAVDHGVFGGAGHFDVLRAMALDGPTRWLGGSFDDGTVDLDGRTLSASVETGFLLRR